MATLVRYNNFPTLFDQAFARDFNRFFGRPVIARYQNVNSNVPAVNVKEDETAFHLELAAPGLKKEDVKVNVENNRLTIAYKHEEQTDETTEKFTRKEFGYTAFERSFRLPKNVNADQIQAAYTDGILKIDLPKVEVKDEKTVKEIAIA
ncbi:heat shock protein Hsp20 [Fibrisoma limi BUZ 3]|uniref:Heat shock protein Hsp20 n=1 Tax=Fibrisoma limi BUZ 3 TaxID=1185876 RepID=I2GKK7_9BACT|nr:Hsp20/alpha crystallin family protein [Fibrisoma limi]CCH54433.1 heat shock protein Hsp20 [Fibrisoma limi BUZ 3]